jgi:hypothetical protein
MTPAQAAARRAAALRPEAGMSWRTHLQIHPACELFPPLPPDELKALGEDIKAHRLQNRVKLWAEKTPDGVRYSVLDGRSRLDAMEAAELPIQVFVGSTPNRNFFEVVEEHVDPWDYVISANIRRRHLTGEQKRDLIAELLKVNPDRSNLQTAKIVGVDDKTVGSVRREMEGRSEIPNVDKTTDTRGRRQPARRPRPSAPPSDAPAPAPAQPAPRKPTTSPIIEQRVNDSERAEASRVLEIARRIRARDPRSDIVTLCNWIEKYAVPMLAATTAEAAE